MAVPVLSHYHKHKFVQSFFVTQILETPRNALQLKPNTVKTV